jgi:threonine/homoserine/homoserine lactone efflux protein
MPQQLIPFLLVVAVLTVTPGPDMALVLRNGVQGGTRLAWWTGLGCCAGIAVHATAAVIGLSALLAASATAYTAVKLVGAAYLVYLGLSALWHSRRTPTATAERPPSGSSPAEAFRQGVLSNVLNPKIALLFLTLLPQFIGGDEPRLATSATLAAVFLGVAVLWWRVFTLLIAPLSHVLAKQRVRTAFGRVTGVVLVALGLRVALEGL